MLTNEELQTLRNLGNEAEAAADEIERLTMYAGHCEEVIAAHNAVGARQEAELDRQRHVIRQLELMVKRLEA